MTKAIHLAVFFCLACAGSGLAQQPQEAAPRADDPFSTAPAAAPDAAAIERGDDRYRIGAGDVLDVRVFNRPQLSRDAVRVDGRGMIRMPLIDGEVQAACRTEGELAAELIERYRRYQRNPQVDVFVKEFQSQPVALIGAVDKPGRFQLQRRVRLLELLTFGGGPAEKAGGRVHLIRADEASRCGAEAGGVAALASSAGLSEAAGQAGGDEEKDSVQVFDLGETLRGDARANPYVRPGDVVSIPEAEQAYVVGNVFRPATVPLRERVTVSRAIAMAGGVLPDTKSDKVRILRQEPGGTTRSEIVVDLKAIDRRQGEDVALRAGDIVDVPTSGGRRFLRSLAGAVAPAISNLPVRVVP